MLGAFAISGVLSSMMMSAPGIAGQITSGGSMSMDGFAARVHGTGSKMARNTSVMASQSLSGEGAKAGGLRSKLANALPSPIRKGLARSSSQGTINAGKGSAPPAPKNKPSASGE